MMISKRYMIAAMMIVCLTAMSISTALASGWSQVASTCVPDNNALLTADRHASGKYDFRGADFQFKPRALSSRNQAGDVFPITVRCHVLNPYEVTSPAWGQLIVSYQDPDGAGTASRVVVKLMRLLRPSKLEVVATFDSNSRAVTDVSDQSVSFSGGMHFYDSDYFVEIHLYRTTYPSNPRVLRVRLDE